MADDGAPRTKGLGGRLGEVGPAWITAIAALLVALTGAGFFAAGRASNPPDATPDATQTVTVTVAPPESTQPAAGDADVFAGELVWGQFNLDSPEPTDLTDGDTRSSTARFASGASIVAVSSGAQVVGW